MPANPRADAISLLRTISSRILDTLAKAQQVRRRAEVLTGGKGFAAEDFDGANTDLTPEDYTALAAAFDDLTAVLVTAQGGPTPAHIALIKFADNPTI